LVSVSLRFGEAYCGLSVAGQAKQAAGIVAVEAEVLMEVRAIVVEVAVVWDIRPYSRQRRSMYGLHGAISDDEDFQASS
jgi:hypothetical protein